MIGDKIHIGAANPRDASWITYNMRESDRVECFSQFPRTSSRELGYALGTEEGAQIAYYDGDPCMVFGVSPMCQVGLSVWAIGTNHCKRVVPAVTRCFVNEIIPAKMYEGYRWMEARSWIDHVDAHDWMKRLGAEPRLLLKDYGNDGEDFILFRWTRDAWYRSGVNKWKQRHAPN
jgi:hypothetical protein